MLYHKTFYVFLGFEGDGSGEWSLTIWDYILENFGVWSINLEWDRKLQIFDENK